MSKRFIISFLSFIITITTASNCCYSKIFVVFRYDDFAGDIPEKRNEEIFRQEIWEKEKKMNEIFKKHKMPYHLAIVPERKSGEELVSFITDYEKVEFVKRGMNEKRIEVSQHGFRHINHVKPGHRSAEFRERSYIEQFNDIEKGKKILEDALQETIDIFVPPFNGWDNETGKALTQLGYHCLSADRYFDYQSISGLHIIPFTAILPQMEAVDLQSSNDSVIVVLFHPADMVDTGQKFGEYGKAVYFSLDKLDDLLARLEKQSDVEVTTFKGLYEKHPFNYDYYEQVVRQTIAYNFMSPIMGDAEIDRNDLVFMPISDHISMYRLLLKITALLCLIFICGGIGGLLAQRWIAQRFWAILIVVIILTVLILVKDYLIINKGFHLTIKHVGPILFLTGFLFAGLMRRCLSLWKRNSSSKGI